MHRAGKRDAGDSTVCAVNTYDHVIVGSFYWDGLGNRWGEDMAVVTIWARRRAR